MSVVDSQEESLRLEIHRGHHWLAMLAAACLGLLSLTASSQQGDVVDVYLFWQKGCPHCERQIERLAAIEARDAGVRAHYFELASEGNRRLYVEAARALGMRELAVPLTVVGDLAMVGAPSDGYIGQTLEEQIAQCRIDACADLLGSIARNMRAVANRKLAMDQLVFAESPPPKPHAQRPGQFVLPWFGEVDLRELSLPALTVVLAAVDGFNPCAMWVLLFLIGLLLGVQDRARRWLLGGAFLLTTAVVYYLVIAAWLGTLLIVGVIPWLRTAIGALALGGGAYYLWEYVRHPQMLCRVAGESRRQRIMSRLRAASAEPRFLVALGAIIVLAVGVNFIELVCSAGIPAVYTQVLAMTPMPAWEHYAWLGLYVAVFLLDDLIIFIAAMMTLEVTGVSIRYAHHAQLLGAAALLAVGTLLIFRPEWLAFG